MVIVVLIITLNTPTSSTVAFILYLYSFTCGASSTENTTWPSMEPTAGTSRREGTCLLRPLMGCALVPRCLRADVDRTEDGAREANRAVLETYPQLALSKVGSHIFILIINIRDCESRVGRDRSVVEAPLRILGKFFVLFPFCRGDSGQMLLRCTATYVIFPLLPAVGLYSIDLPFLTFLDLSSKQILSS